MSVTLPELIVFSGAVYGLSWLLTKSKLFERFRKILAALPFVGRLLQCIVCTAPWVAAGLLAIGSTSSRLVSSIRPHGVIDIVVLLGWTLFATWSVARLLGDAS